MLIATGVVEAYVPVLAERMPRCFLRTVVGIRCPTCGTGTALGLLARGQLLDALRASWFAVALVASLLCFVGYLALSFVLRRKLTVELSRRDSWVVAAAGFLALGLAWVFQGR